MANLLALMYHRPEDHQRLSPSEFEHIRSDPPEKTDKVAWASSFSEAPDLGFRDRQISHRPSLVVLSLLAAEVLESAIRTHYRDHRACPCIYVAADIGSIGGGWLSSALIKRGWTINAARKTAMLICALCVVPIIFAARASNLWVAVALVSLGMSAHQGWSANLYTITSDMFPRNAVGSAINRRGTVGALGGVFVATAAGYILQITGSYYSLFAIAGSMYLIALGIIHLLAPRLEPADV